MESKRDILACLGVTGIGADAKSRPLFRSTVPQTKRWNDNAQISVSDTAEVMARFRLRIGGDGPVIHLGIWVGRAAAYPLIAQGQAAPSTQTIRALIDTRADQRTQGLA
jgi:hypothetical protein